jgi:hypothetical protein
MRKEALVGFLLSLAITVANAAIWIDRAHAVPDA